MCQALENRRSHWKLAFAYGPQAAAPHSGTVLSKPFVQFMRSQLCSGGQRRNSISRQLITYLQSALTGPLRARAFPSEFVTSGSSNSEYLVRRVHGSTCALGNSTPPDSLSNRAI